MSGKKGADLNEAIKEHRIALDRVQRDLRRRKLSGPTVDKATQTLRVASLDPELWPLLERGLLHEDLSASGFGLDPGIVPARPKGRPAPKAAAPAKPKPDKKADEKRKREANERLREAKSALAEAEKQALAAARGLERARADVERAQQRLDRI